jgi:hypothetical protein
MRLSFLPPLSDWPFAVKMGLAPALALAGVIFLGLLGSAGNIAQSRLVHRVVAQDLPAATALLQTASALAQADALLSRDAQQQQPGASSGTSDAALGQVRDSLEDSRARLAATQTETAGPLADAQADIGRLSRILAYGGSSLAGHAGPASLLAPEAAAHALRTGIAQAALFLKQDAEAAAIATARQSARLTAAFGTTALVILALVTACCALSKPKISASIFSPSTMA